MKRIVFGMFLFCAVAAFAAAPTISNVSIVPASDARTVTITYDLDTDAYVTLALESGGVALAPQAYGGIGGNVNRLVAAGTGRQIVWRPDRVSAPADLSTVKPVLTAWHKDVPPTYMVVDLQGGVVTYHASTNEIPYGIANRMYKTTHLVMAKVPAAGRTWLVGSSPFDASREQGTPIREIQHLVTFTNDFYMGIYEFTGGQWLQFMSSNPSNHPFNDKDVCPLEHSNYDTVRGNAYTAAPAASSLIGLMRKRTGLAIDLPRHAQWEVAARAGCTGLVNVPGATLDDVAWTQSNYRNDPKFASGEYTGNNNCTHEVGLLMPNAFGLYDMQGNVLEIGIDKIYYQSRAVFLASLGLTEETVRTTPVVEQATDASSITVDGTTYKPSQTCGRWGGGYREAAGNSQSCSRWAAYSFDVDTGFRVMCPVANGGRLAQ